MQIKRLDRNALDAASLVLEYCTDNAMCKLSDYFSNDWVEVYGAFDDGLCGVLVMMFTPDFADILDIAVCPDNRKRGIATALMEYGINECKTRGIPAQLLEVRTSNTPAIRLYEKLGFKQISKRHNYYSAPTEDALIYRRKL